MNDVTRDKHIKKFFDLFERGVVALEQIAARVQQQPITIQTNNMDWADLPLASQGWCTPADGEPPKDWPPTYIVEPSKGREIHLTFEAPADASIIQLEEWGRQCQAIVREAKR